MVLPTYLDIKEAAKRIEKHCHEPVTPEWLLQHAGEGRLQLFALVRDDVSVIVQPKDDAARPTDIDKLSAKEVIRIIDKAIKIVHQIGSRIPIADEWANRFIAEGTASIREVSVDGKQETAIHHINSNPTLHSDGRITAWPWPWKVRMNDLCFRSEDIARLIDANTPEAATQTRKPTAPTETRPAPAKPGAGNTATEDEQPEPVTDGRPSGEDADAQIAQLFDPVTVAALEKMFPADGKWAGWAEHASRNKGLKAARTERGRFNPYLAGIWFAGKGIKGWDLARCRRALANNLPDRSLDDKHRLTGELE